jgi:Carboxypeptidase regulatory-like domain/TonB dependent receptor/TonB-dependent Receptor Plug Domain
MKHLTFSALAALALLSGAALAQTNVASITGIVADASGAVVRNAEVIITNIETGIASRTQTNDAGVYFVSSLNPGRYRIEVQAQGFRRKQVDNLQIETGQKARLDLALEIGNVSEAVEIQGAAPLLQRETAEVSETISAKEIRNLPLATRAPYNLLSLSAGVVAGGNDPSDLDYSGAVSVNGSRTRGTAFVVDGASTTHIGGIGERVGSIEAIQEFKVLSSTYSAEYGRTSGGVITFQVKSGTQQFHGSAYEYYRSSALGANAWENNARNVARPGLLRHEFGGTLGGPFPKMNKKLFFFASYEGVRDSIPASSTRTIPDSSYRNGDFSASPVRIIDPLTGMQFPDNKIPQSRLDPAAVKFLQLFPTPNQAGTLDPRFNVSANNWFYLSSTSDFKNFGVGRLDYNPTDKDRLFFTFSHVNEGPRVLVRDFPNELTTQVGPRFRNIQRATIGYTRTFGATLTNELIAYGQRDPRKITPWHPDFDARQQLGIQRTIGIGLPRVTISGFGDYSNTQVQDWVHQPAGLSDTVTWVNGRHTLKMGAQLYQNQFWYISSPNLSGDYSFNGEITGGGVAGRNNPIYALADFLLGAVKTANIPVPQIPANRYNYNLGLFLNDDWKVTNKLTLNLGLRYEFETKQAVKNHIYSRVDLRTGDLLVAGSNASKNLNLENDNLNFAPRLGISYSINDKTVIRSGFAIFYSNFWVDNGELVSYPGFTATQAFVDQGAGRAQPFTFSQGFPVAQVPVVTDPLALVAAASAAQPLPVGAVTYNADDQLPANYQWNLSVQRSFWFDTIVEAAYVGSRSVHLARTIPANNPALDQSSRVVIDRVPIQQVRPYPKYTGFSAVLYDATSNYHSFQLKATRRFSQGLSVDGNYTFSKNIDTASREADSFQIPWQFPQLERALSSLDRTHVFTVGAVYELPFGKSKTWLREGALAHVVGGFQLNGIIMASSGVPLTITQNNTNTILQTQRPNVKDPNNVSGRVAEPSFVQGGRRWLIPAADPNFPFMQSSNIGIGNLGRNTGREPGYVNFDLSLFRNVPITERIALQFRVEAFNAFNHVNYREPSSTNIVNANYGLITAAAPPRRIQLSARLSF